MIHDAVRKREQPPPASLLSLVHQAIDNQYDNNNPASKILDCISSDKESVLALRQVCRAFKQWLAPLSSFLFHKVTFVYPTLVGQKRRNSLQRSTTGILYGQVLVSIVKNDFGETLLILWM